jgi:hypothetical protein
MPLRTAYPSIFGLFYPDCGDFIGFIANFHSRRLIQHAAYCFRDYADFPLEHVAALGFVLGVSWSEYRSFWHYGNRAFMVTDTALCRYPYYHSADDTPDKLTYVDLGRITDGLIGCFTEIARSGIVDRAV